VNTAGLFIETSSRSESGAHINYLQILFIDMF
jgi:hypothetical protein